MDCLKTLAKPQAFGYKLRVSFGAHMTQIGVPRDRRPNSYFGGMRKKSLRELKEQPLALCVKQVGTNEVPASQSSLFVGESVEDRSTDDGDDGLSRIYRNLRHASCV